ncbi:MAG: cache domain-containing protein [Azonexus sp.]|jgi:signal transduction histidine kinase|uniref:cache domain-containing protein n=1 Tax=Azonexus sp. TaxID=1872668 RepID=UPI002839D291|nr:cache domain-containing protein [Azonexus sp.]MDR0775940.1 cache domain-containing protein [Azonexus sp.]
MKLHHLLFGVLSALALTTTVYASEKDEAVAQVSAAAKAVSADRAAGLKAIQEGKFTKGDVYAFAYALSGEMLAHPKNPRLVGKNMLDQPDAEGKLFRKELIEKAKAGRKDWTDYVYMNPETKAMEQKTTYCEKAGDVVVCAGVYR